MVKNLAGSLRIGHWYKNLLAFLGLVFERRLFDLTLFSHALLVFALLCLVSSSNYIINDLVDKKHDVSNQIKEQSLFAQLHPRVSASIAIVLFSASILLSVWLVPGVVFFLILVGVLGQAYNLFAKNVPVLDVIVLLLIYLSRIYAGYISLNVVPYSLIVLPIVMLALFLVFIKKRSTLLILGEAKAIAFRRSYTFYTKPMSNAMITISGIGMAVLYLVYVVINEKFTKLVLVLTIPAVFMLILAIVKKTSESPELGIFLFKVLKKRLVLLVSCYIVALYLFDILFL